MWDKGALLGGRYRLLERIGSGSMGEVWRAEDLTLERAVAVKIMLPALLEEAGFTERFLREARILAALDHPGIVKVHDYGANVDPHAVFLVMELVDGRPLNRLIAEEGTLDPALTLSIVAQTLDALAAAHACGIVHRDVKPMNLLLRDGIVTVADFGVAYAFGAQRLTNRGMMLGTVLYSAPEQAGFGSVTPSADLYSVGVVAYECLTGRPPFTDEDGGTVLLKHAQDPVPALPEQIPQQVRDLVLRALAKDPADRFADAAQMSAVARAAAAVLGPTSAADHVRPRSAAVATPSLRPTLVDEEDVRATLPAASAPRAPEPPSAASDVRASSSRRRPYAILSGAAAVLAIGALGTYLALGGGPGGAQAVGDGPSAAAAATSSAPESSAPARPAAVGATTQTVAAPGPAPRPSGSASASAPGATATAPAAAGDPYPVTAGSPYPGVFPSDTPAAVKGVLSCLSGAPILGVWVQAVQDGKPGSGFASYQLTADGKHTQYWFTLPESQTYDLSVGCGGTQKHWAVTAKVDSLTSPSATFECDDESADADFQTCAPAPAG